MLMEDQDVGLELPDQSSDIDYIPTIRVPSVTKGCIRLSRVLMYLAVATAAGLLAAMVIVNYENVSLTMANARSLSQSLDERKGHYLTKVDDTFEKADAAVKRVVTLVSDELVPMLSSTSTDTKETVDKFLNLLKTYTTKGRVTLEVPL